MPASKKPKKSLSDDHKAALSSGRTASNAVKRYLDAIEANRPKRGRKRTVETVHAQLEAIAEEIATASSITRLNLIQKQTNLTKELGGFDDVVDMSALEADFVAHALAYSETKGISRATWRALNVPSELLDEAGIPGARG